MFKKNLRLLFRSSLFILGFVVLYLAAVFILPNISVNDDFDIASEEKVEIYILTNGVHTDIVLPYTSPYKSWSPFVKVTDTKSEEVDPKFVAFGWGDKGFYLDTPTWADLKFSTAFKAMFFLSTSAMHVSYYDDMRESEVCKRIEVSKRSYLRMVHYIENSFQRDANGRPKLLVNASYANNDCFYDARGTYNLFFTCNSWANEGLKSSGLKACFWTATKDGIFDLYSSPEAI